MTVWERPVFSGRAQQVSYDDTTQEMTVLWRNGRSTIYSGVSEDAAIELSNAPSVGSMINTDFTGKYRHRNV